VTRLQTRSTLPDENRTAGNQLSTKTLYPKPLSVGVAAITGTSDAFLMSHDALLITSKLLSLNFLDLYSGERLPVTPKNAILLLSFVFENDHFPAFANLHDGSQDSRIGDSGRSDNCSLAIVDCQDFLELHRLSRSLFHFLNANHISRRNPVLLATRFYDCEHERLLPPK
jgi:hypothetical protein